MYTNVPFGDFLVISSDSTLHHDLSEKPQSFSASFPKEKMNEYEES